MPEFSENSVKISPPYTSFQSFCTFVAGLKEHGVPARIDRSVLQNFSGAVGSQIMTASRFLGLIGSANEPTEAMQQLVKAYSTDTWADELSKVVKTAYGPIFELDLMTATPSQFTEQFRKHYNGADAVLRKCITFFLNACREANLPVSNRILSGTKPRSATTRKRPVKAKKKGPRQRSGRSDDEDDDPDTSDKRLPSQVIFDEFKPGDMDDHVQAAAITLMTYFKSIGR